MLKLGTGIAHGFVTGETCPDIHSTSRSQTPGDPSGSPEQECVQGALGCLQRGTGHWFCGRDGNSALIFNFKPLAEGLTLPTAPAGPGSGTAALPRLPLFL